MIDEGVNGLLGLMGVRVGHGVLLVRGERFGSGGTIVCVFDSCMIVRMDTNECVVRQCNEKGKPILSQIVTTANSSAASNPFFPMSFPSSFLAHSVDHHSNSSSSEAFVGGFADLWIDAGVVALVRLYGRV